MLIHLKKRSPAFLLVAACTAFSWSQSPGAKVQGTVKDKGQPVAGADVVFINPDLPTTYRSRTDENGVFEISGLPTGGNYHMEITNASGLKIFVSDKLAFNAEASGPAVLAIDASDVSKTDLYDAAVHRHYTPEEIAALKAQLAKAQTENPLIRQAVEAMMAKRWNDAIPPLRQLIAYDPDRYEFYQSLGEAHLNLGQYDEALQSFQKGIQIAGSNIAPSFPNPANDPEKKKTRVTNMLVDEGNAYLKLGKKSEAIAAFTRATKMDPNSAVAQFNLCATLYNMQKIDAALPVCEKSIALEPQRADTYFIKGRMLFQKKKTIGAAKVQVPPGTAAALKKYLELQPEGAHAKEARNMLAMIFDQGTTN